jgi:hypothetical protein
MYKYCRNSLVAITLLITPVIVIADYITINGPDGSYDMYAGYLDGILSGTNNQFAMSDLDTLAAILNNDGINTIGTLSFVLADTDAGLSLIGLFDGVVFNDPLNSNPNQFLALSSTTTMDTDWFATGDVGSEVAWYDMGNGTQVVAAQLAWDQEMTSAGFAWGDVSTAQSGTMNLYDIDLTEFAPEPIQFITYQDNQWTVVGQAAFSILGQYAFSYQYIPAPSVIALLSIAGISGRRKRRI